MTKLFVNVFIIIAITFSYIDLSDSAMSGVCVNCHVMHNSQDGIPVDINGTNDALLRDWGNSSSCITCHTKPGIAGAPIIDGGESDYTAAGSFADLWVTSASNAHNVEDLFSFNAGNPDNILGNKAPGGIDFGSVRLKCAGTYGCHGSHDNKPTSDEGMANYHHYSNAYRFLEVAAGNSGSGIAVGGIGSPDCEKGGATATNHNLYLSDEIKGISKLCCNCHSIFHADSGVWIRHPVDVSINNLNGDATESLIYNPYAFTASDMSGMSTSSMTGYDDNSNNPKVMCLSCHRAHASKYKDLLRFDYLSQDAGSGQTTGCLGCHVEMR